MRLYLSKRSPLRSVYTNEFGEAIYKVETPLKLSGQTITIARSIPADIPHRDGEAALENRFAHLAQIDWRYIESTKIRFAGNDLDDKTFFRKEGLGWYGLRDRVFTATDGKEYKWFLGARIPELKLNDESKTPVAQFHEKIGVFKQARPAFLEIFPAGEHMVDEILVTFVYIAKLKEDAGN